MKKIINTIVTVIAAAFAIGNMSTVNAHAEDTVYYTNMSDLVAALKELQHDDPAIWYKDGRGMTIMYKYVYTSVEDAKLSLEYCRLYDEETYKYVMDYMAENNLTIEDAAGWTIDYCTWTTETIWEEIK